MVVRLGGYARISLDKNGEELGVERQRRDYRQVAGVRPGWEVARDYVDNDMSAFKRNVVRPEFERLLVDLQSGVIDGVIAYDLDRLARQPRDLERLIDVFEDRPELIFCTVTNDIDLSTSDGRTMARVMVAFANKASADTGRRVARKHRELADAGKNGGGFPPFGWKADRVTIDPEQAELITKTVFEICHAARCWTLCSATFLDIEEGEAVCGDELIRGVTRYAVRHEPVFDLVPGREPVRCGHVAEFSSAGFSDDQRIRLGRQTLGEPSVERASDLPPELALVVDELLTAGGRPHPFDGRVRGRRQRGHYLGQCRVARTLIGHGCILPGVAARCLMVLCA
ncbi:recombinase family protein [Streptomyces cahuitamycinicus]|uniref:Resolvase/invertase-type recombinase catalytic domain-containing protein n=1 Tax=Streptomyces cahuitamycinicus TaxID=2070367 RepID=A0A2N8TFZ4_9ACTN|nr:recombinase family protein [Streptomyces cahuitamycinicus]PNG17937.1 hypothetical protein C1J00_33790 [Streptomyces cahuitamycinicus]